MHRTLVDLTDVLTAHQLTNFIHDLDADARQDKALAAAGYETLRFTDEDVYQRPQRILDALGGRYPRVTVKTPGH